jgi:fibronectin type 3 domain-containing protein
MQPTETWFNGGGRWYSNPSDWTNPNNVAGFLNYMKAAATVMSDTSPKYGRDHGWYCSFVRVNTDSIGGWTQQNGLVNPTQFNAWIQNFVVPYADHLRSRGLYLVLCATGPINTPNNGSRNAGVVEQQRLITFWETVANAPGVKNADNIMFELMNEPVEIETFPGSGIWGFGNSTYFSAFRDWIQPVIDAVRNTGADNVIWVPTLEWQGSPHQHAQFPFTGTNCGIAVHFYPAYGGVFDNPTKVQNLWNSQYKPAADRWPMIVTECFWFPMPDDPWNLVNGTTAGFGNALKNAMDNQGNVSYLVGFLSDLLENLNSSLPADCILSPKEGSQAFFDWLPTYTWAAPTDRPMGLSATVLKNSQINLAWTAVPNASSYNIKRSTTPGGPYVTMYAGITATRFSDTNVTAGELYDYVYVVSANVPEGESPNSNEAVPAIVHACLKFNETAGSTAFDASGNNWNGSLVNGPLWAAGKFGNAVDLDGTNDHVALPAGVVNGLTQCTISMWVYQDVISTWSRIFDFGTGTSNYMFLTPRHTNSGGTVRFAIRTPTVGEQVISGTSALPAGVWTHVAVTLSGNLGILYVNGLEVGRNTAFTLNPSSLGVTTQNYIGKSQWPDPYLNGRVDEFRIYADALSAPEVAMLYTEQIPAAIPSTPTGLSAAAGQAGQIDLVWDGSPGATNYNLKRSTTSGGPYTLLTSVSGTNCSDTGLMESTTYYYVVSAVNSLGESADSAQEGAATIAAPPAVPSGLVAAAGDGSILLNWNANIENDLAGYNVYRSTTSGSGYTLLNDVLLSDPAFTDHNVSFHKNYYYVVTAVDNDLLESAFSGQVSAASFDGRAVVLSAADFEIGFGEWGNISGDDSHNWTRNSGGTMTPNTGPSGGAGGSTWYVYLETSPGGANTAGNTAILQGPMIDGCNRVLTFYYHMHGAATGTLNVDIFHNGAWINEIWSRSGQQHSAITEAYTQAIVNLAGYSGPIRLRLRAAAAGGPTGDIAIDHIEVKGRILYGDMNEDDRVDIDDLVDFAGNWLRNNCGLDLDGDCTVTMYEFAEFARDWLDDAQQN